MVVLLFYHRRLFFSIVRFYWTCAIRVPLFFYYTCRHYDMLCTSFSISLISAAIVLLKVFSMYVTQQQQINNNQNGVSITTTNSLMLILMSRVDISLIFNDAISTYYQKPTQSIPVSWMFYYSKMQIKSSEYK